MGCTQMWLDSMPIPSTLENDWARSLFVLMPKIQVRLSYFWFCSFAWLENSAPETGVALRANEPKV